MEQGLKDILKQAKKNAKGFGEWSQYAISCHTLINIIEIVQEQEVLLTEAKQVLEPFAKAFENTPVYIDDYEVMDGLKYKEMKSIADFLKKLEDLTA